MKRWGPAERLTLAGVLATIFFGIPAWLVVFKPTSSGGSTTTSITMTAPPSARVPSHVHAVKLRRAPVLPRTNEATHIYSTPVGTVWVEIRRMRGSTARTSVVAMSWGAKHRSEQVRLDRGPVFLEMNKSGTDHTPINITTVPAALIAFGRRADPHGQVIDVDAGWSG